MDREYPIGYCGAINGHRYVEEVMNLDNLGARVEEKHLARLAAESIHLEYFCKDCPVAVGSSMVEHLDAADFDVERFNQNHEALREIAVNLDCLLSTEY